MDGSIIVIVVLVIVAGIIFRLLAGGMDHDRVKNYVRSRGGDVIESNWAPFGKGWFGEKSDRIYNVRYKDRDGNEHEAHVKTSLLSGVYFTEDRITRYADRPARRQATTTLEEENRRLREEVERLRNQQA